MYEAIDSKYTYKGTDILKNKLNIMDEDLLKEYQTKVVAFKLSTINYIKMDNNFDENKLRFIHKYLFDEVYYFAGEYRQENITKGNFRFSEYIYIEENLKKIMREINIDELKKLPFDEYVTRISYFMTELNVLHPFREGNGRTIREFIRELCSECGYVINWSEVDYDDILKASIEAILDETMQIELLRNSIRIK